MNKEDFIKKYGKEKYAKQQEQTKEWHTSHPTQVQTNREKWRNSHLAQAKTSLKEWKIKHPAQVQAHNRKRNRKGGEFYEKKKEYQLNGIPHAKGLIPGKHQRQWKLYKKIIDPEGLTQIHHQWLPGTANYTGVALVEADQHLHGFIDVIQILEGEIILFTEEVIRGK